ncbi:MAG TPA: hypothetical protein VI390_05680, partial [Methyloceanibacter sp.]
GAAPVADVPEPDPSDKRPEDTATAANTKPLPPRVPEEITPPAEDPFHPDAPDSYKGVSSGDASKY